MPLANVIGISNTAFLIDNKCNPNITSIDFINMPFTNTSLAEAFYSNTGTNLISITNINFTNITNLYRTFSGCNKLTTTPNIPDTITNMAYAFENCSNLTVTPHISNNTTNLESAFYGCTNIANTPVIPNSVTHLHSTFAACKSIPVPPSIPNSVVDLHSTFSFCNQFTDGPIIPNSVTSMLHTFSYCAGLINAPVIPDSVTNMVGTFTFCTGLTNISAAIPNSVVNMSQTFMRCQNITSTPNIPSSVTDLHSTYSSCTKLTGDIYIESTNITNADTCFGNTNLTKNVYIPYAFVNGEFTSTYNSFISAGYDKNGTTDNVYLKDTTAVTLTINPTPSDATVTLTCTGYTQSGNSIEVSNGKTVTYTVTKGNMSVTNTVTMGTANQTIPVELLATLTINPTPSNATVTLTASGYTQSGKSITVPAGTSVAYSVSYSGLQTQSNNNYIVNDTETKNIALTYASGTVLLEKSAAGTYTFTPIAPVNCTIICIGAGGGATESWQTGGTAAIGAVLAAGGSGGYSRNTNATISSQVTAIVGNYSETGTGGTTSVGSLCSANGGQAGYASTSGGSYGGPGGSGNYSNGNTGECESHIFTTTETLTKNGGAAKLGTYGKGCGITTQHSRRSTTTSGVYIHSHTTTINAGTAGYIKITAN